MKIHAHALEGIFRNGVVWHFATRDALLQMDPEYGVLQKARDDRQVGDVVRALTWKSGLHDYGARRLDMTLRYTQVEWGCDDTLASCHPVCLLRCPLAWGGEDGESVCKNCRATGDGIRFDVDGVGRSEECFRHPGAL